MNNGIIRHRLRRELSRTIVQIHTDKSVNRYQAGIC